MKPHLIITAVALVLLAFSACKQRQPDAMPTDIPVTPETELWRLTTIAVDPTPMQVPDSLKLTLRLQSGKVDGHGGCNGFGGNYELNGNQLIVTGLMQTEMYCEGISDWEQRFLERLQKSESYRLDGSTLEIHCGDMGNLVFTVVF
ncbi:MAG: META domain-containing protein [Saprospiraceae bacterium]|nr:META domain-containing protein [Saprospiraceae bacterium]